MSSLGEWANISLFCSPSPMPIQSTMANWKHKLNISRQWEAAREDRAALPALASTIADKLKRITTGDEYLDDTRDELVLDFQDFARDNSTDTADFDSIMSSLYDWADTQLDDNWPPAKLCWIET